MTVKIAEKNPYDRNKINYRNYRLVNQCTQPNGDLRIRVQYLWLYEEENNLMVPENPCYSVSDALRSLMEALMFDTRQDYIRLEIHYEDALLRDS